jgi:hypothetical protein
MRHTTHGEDGEPRLERRACLLAGEDPGSVPGGGYAKEDCVGRAHFDVADARPLVQARRAVEHAAHIFRASWGR